MPSEPQKFGATNDDFTVLNQIAGALTSSLDLESILFTIMRQIERFFAPETWALLLIDEQRKDLHCVIGDGSFNRPLAEIRIPIGEGIAGKVAAAGEPVILAKIEAGQLIMTDAERALDSEIRSEVCIPLRSRQQTFGVIQLFNLPPEAFSESSISALTVLSEFAAIAIDNARAFQRVQELTIIDECTGLYNLRHFQVSLQREIARCQRAPGLLSLIFIDLDHFKLINDRHGHQIGTQLLAQISGTIKAHVRSVDLCFRYGGDEFAVLLPGADKRTAIKVAERLVATLRKTTFPIPSSASVDIRASVGISSYPEDAANADELLRIADDRMYGIKETTGDGVCAVSDERTGRRLA